MNFLPVKNYEELYEVSDCGIVRSVDRYITGRDSTQYFKKGRNLKQLRHKDLIYFVVSLWKNNKGLNKYVHRLVAETHIPNPNNLPEVNHLDGNRLNNHIDNLEWCTSSENSIHAVQTGLRTYTNKLTKEEFTECLFSVIDGESYLSVSKRVPYKVPYLSVKLRKLAKEMNIEGELDESLYFQKVERARVNGAKNK